MRSPRRLLGLWRSLFSRSRLDRELDEELRDYLEALVERKVRAGLGEAEARRTALVEMGGLEQVKDEVRSGRAFSGLLATMGDLRHAFRMIGRMPGLAAVVIGSLGVGIGVNTAVFSWIQAVVLRPLPGVATPRLLARGAARGNRILPRGLVARVPGPEGGARRVRGASGLSDGLLEPGRGQSIRAHLRSARLRQLLLEPGPSAGARAVPGRERHPGRGARSS